MPEKKDSTVDEVEVVETVEEAPVEEAPVEDAPVEVVVAPATVTVKLTDDYSGPTPVYVSTGVEPLLVDRVELSTEGVDVPSELVDNLLALPWVELAEDTE